MREFIMITFSEVSDFKREDGNQQINAKFREHYASKQDMPPVVIQALRRRASENRYYLELWFGPNFGGLSFHYLSCKAFTKGSIALKVNGQFQYKDNKNGESFSFYDPFGLEDESGR